MPAPPRPDPPTRALRLSIEGEYDGAAWTNVLWLYLTGSGEITIATLNELVGAVGAAYATRFAPLLDNDLLISLAHGVLQIESGGAIEAFQAIGEAGTVEGPGLPANVAACLSWHVAAHYRGGHPRTYFCGVPQEAQHNATTFKSDFLDGIINAGTAFHADVEALGPYDGIATVEHGTVSFVDAGAWRTPPIFRRFVRDPTMDSRIDTQRRRLGRDRS